MPEGLNSCNKSLFTLCLVSEDLVEETPFLDRKHLEKEKGLLSGASEGIHVLNKTSNRLQPIVSDETFADLLPWQFFDRDNKLYVGHLDHAIDFSELTAIDKAEFELTWGAAKAHLQSLRIFPDPTLVHGYRRLHRAVGSQYRYVFTGQIDRENARYTIDMTRGFDGHLQTAGELSLSRSSPVVNVVVPVRGRWPTLLQFLAGYAAANPAANNLRLVLVCFADGMECGDMRDFVTNQLKRVGGREGDGLFTMLQQDGPFSRAVGLARGAAAVPDTDILFFCDVDMVVDTVFYQRCRDNTRLGEQVFFPTVYTLYPNGQNVARNEGFFRDLGYGMACMYRTDFDRVGGYQNAALFQGWGKDDVDLCARFLESELTVFRAMEPGLRHKWHEKSCHSSLPQDPCVSSMLSTLGSQEVIARTLWERGIGYEELDVQKSKLITSGSKQGAGDQEYIAEWERKLKEKQRKKRPSRPPLENIYLAPNDRE